MIKKLIADEVSLFISNIIFIFLLVAFICPSPFKEISLCAAAILLAVDVFCFFRSESPRKINSVNSHMALNFLVVFLFVMFCIYHGDRTRGDFEKILYYLVAAISFCVSVILSFYAIKPGKDSR